MENESLKRSMTNYLPTTGNVIVVLNVMEAEKSNMMMNRIGTRCPADMITIKKTKSNMTQKPKNLPAIILDMPNEEYHRGEWSRDFVSSNTA